MGPQKAADRFRPHRYHQDPANPGVCLGCGLIKANAIHVDIDAPDPAALRAGERPDQEET